MKRVYPMLSLSCWGPAFPDSASGRRPGTLSPADPGRSQPTGAVWMPQDYCTEGSEAPGCGAAGACCTWRVMARPGAPSTRGFLCRWAGSSSRPLQVPRLMSPEPACCSRLAPASLACRHPAEGQRAICTRRGGQAWVHLARIDHPAACHKQYG